MTVPADLHAFFTDGEPDDLPPFLFVPRQQPLLAGSSVTALVGQAALRRSGLVVPTSGRELRPIDFAVAYVTTSEYLDPIEPAAAELIIQSYLNGKDFRSVISNLVGIHHLTGDETTLSELSALYLDMLKPTPRTKLEGLLSSTRPRHVFLARQLSMRAMRFAIELQASCDGSEAFSHGQAILLSHLSADAMNINDPEFDHEEYGGFPAGQAMDLVRNLIFNRSQETLRLFARTQLLWSIEPDATRYPLRASPADLLLEATGLTPIEWLAFGLATIAHRNAHPPPGPPWMPASFFSMSDPDKLQRFLAQTSADVVELSTALHGQDTKWGFVAIEQTPILRDGSEYLLLDQQFLEERVSEGLYWYVFDYESAIGSEDRWAWTRAFGGMFEHYALTIIKRLAPPLLDGSALFYDEEEIGTFTASKKCDGAIDLGADMVLFEVVGGRLTLRSRVDGDPAALAEKTEQLVLDKADQLGTVVGSLLEDEAALTGHPAPQGRRYFPVIVNIGYPVNPITMSVIEIEVDESGWFGDPRVAPLSIINVSELEIVEALTEAGLSTLPDLLRSWHGADLRRMDLFSHIHTLRLTADPHRYRSSELVETWNSIESLMVEALVGDEISSGESE